METWVVFADIDLSSADILLHRPDWVEIYLLWILADLHEDNTDLHFDFNLEWILRVEHEPDIFASTLFLDFNTSRVADIKCLEIVTDIRKAGK